MCSVVGQLPVVPGSAPMSEVDLWNCGLGPKTPQRSTAPSPAPRSMLELELELSSEPVREVTEPWLLNQLLTHTKKHLKKMKFQVPNLPSTGKMLILYLRFCLGDDWGVPDGVDWAEDGCLSSLMSTFCICSFYNMGDWNSNIKQIQWSNNYKQIRMSKILY